MEHDIRSLLADELAAEPEPPIGDLVESSIATGRRMRTRRSLWLAATTAALTLVAVGAVAGWAGIASRSGGAAGNGPATAAAGGTVAETPTVTPSATPSWTPPTGAAATGPKVAATPEAALELLLSLLPPGATSGLAKASDGTLGVQAYLDDGTGPGMLRLFLHSGTPGNPALKDDPPPSPDPATCATRAKPDVCQRYQQRLWDNYQAASRTMITLPDGHRAEIIDEPTNCVQRTTVIVQHADGTVVELNLASCLAREGTTNPQARVPLTTQQALAVANDSRWGLTMASSLVTAGKAHFPHLPAIPE